MTHLFDDQFLKLLKKEDPQNVILQMSHEGNSLKNFGAKIPVPNSLLQSEYFCPCNNAPNRYSKTGARARTAPRLYNQNLAEVIHGIEYHQQRKILIRMMRIEQQNKVELQRLREQRKQIKTAQLKARRLLEESQRQQDRQQKQLAKEQARQEKIASICSLAKVSRQPRETPKQPISYFIEQSTPEENTKNKLTNLLDRKRLVTTAQDLIDSRAQSDADTKDDSQFSISQDIKSPDDNAHERLSENGQRKLTRKIDPINQLNMTQTPEILALTKQIQEKEITDSGDKQLYETVQQINTSPRVLLSSPGPRGEPALEFNQLLLSEYSDRTTRIEQLNDELNAQKFIVPEKMSSLVKTNIKNLSCLVLDQTRTKGISLQTAQLQTNQVAGPCTQDSSDSQNKDSTLYPQLDREQQAVPSSSAGSQQNVINDQHDSTAQVSESVAETRESETVQRRCEENCKNQDTNQPPKEAQSHELNQKDITQRETVQERKFVITINMAKGASKPSPLQKQSKPKKKHRHVRPNLNEFQNMLPKSRFGEQQNSDTSDSSASQTSTHNSPEKGSQGNVSQQRIVANNACSRPANESATDAPSQLDSASIYSSDIKQSDLALPTSLLDSVPGKCVSARNVCNEIEGSPTVGETLIIKHGQHDKSQPNSTTLARDDVKISGGHSSNFD